jgi:hypothetical protein
LIILSIVDVQYQTKDTPLQTLDNYKIEQDQDSGHWRLWHEEYDAEWIEEEGLFGGTLVQSNWRWVRCDDFDGEIRFYYYRSEGSRRISGPVYGRAHDQD